MYDVMDSEQTGVSIIYEDKQIVAIHKPAGLLVHRSMMDRHETRFALQMTRNATGKKVYPIHRLDKPTSGIMIFAFSSEVATLMQTQFQGHTVHKTYLALVRGWPKEKSWIIDKPLKYHVDKYSESEVKENKMQPATTHFKLHATAEINQPVGPFPTARYALVQAYPHTGRKHQLRRHLNHCNHPVVGDVNHGDRHHNQFFREYFNQSRLYLAATELDFKHPISGEAMQLNSLVQENFQQVIDQINWRSV